jgi:zinc transport system substrate-binding protein
MRRATRLVALAAGMFLASPSNLPAASDVKVVVTIKPLHALVAGVMAGVALPELLVKGAASPHTFSLRPSEVRALNDAHVLFRMSEVVEPFTSKIVKSLRKEVEVITLQDAPGLALLTQRAGATFEQHSAGGDRGHGHHHSHAVPRKGQVIDGHAWLDPDNAKAMIGRIEQALTARYPAHAASFKANAGALRSGLDRLTAELAVNLEPVAERPYIVFHDALQYLERRYRLNVVGSILINPEVPPSGKRLGDLRRKILSLGAVCVFVEPGIDTRLVDNLIEGTSARTATLDPEGIRLEPGPDLYPTLMRRLAADLRSCLLPQT